MLLCYDHSPKRFWKCYPWSPLTAYPPTQASQNWKEVVQQHCPSGDLNLHLLKYGPRPAGKESVGGGSKFWTYTPQGNSAIILSCFHKNMEGSEERRCGCIFADGNKVCVSLFIIITIIWVFLRAVSVLCEERVPSSGCLCGQQGFQNWQADSFLLESLLILFSPTLTSESPGGKKKQGKMIPLFSQWCPMWGNCNLLKNPHFNVKLLSLLHLPNWVFENL